MGDRTSQFSFSSDISTRRADFRTSLIARDGACVMTGDSESAQACHIIPHAKGDQYMVNLVQRRDPALSPPLTSIDDPRNGILLSPALRPPFGASQVAFLRTPNFAMTADDVASILPPFSGPAVQQSVATSRLTFQNFTSQANVVRAIATHNSDARQSDCDLNWPPQSLFDIAYGCAALQTWGTRQFKIFAMQHTGNRDDVGGSTGGDSDNSKGGRERHNHCAARRTVTREKAQGAVDITDIVIRLWMHNARKATHEASVMTEETREKVQQWLQSTVPLDR